MRHRDEANPGLPCDADGFAERGPRSPRPVGLAITPGASVPLPFTSCFSDAVAGFAGFWTGGNPHLIAIGEAVRGAGDDAVIAVDAGGEFDLAAEVAGDGDGLEQDLSSA